MNKPQLILPVVLASIIIACHSSKKTVTSTAPPATSTATNTITAPAPLPEPINKPSNGIYLPGNDELAAIQPRYNDITLDKLKQGYSIYSEGACIKCHNAQNIYKFDEFQWGRIIDDMALKARLGPAEKDAVYKYVLAIKAVKSK